MDTYTQVEPLLSVKQLKTYYPIRRGIIAHTEGYIKAVDGVDLEIYRRETLGIVGESGCGKSTLARTLVGLEKAYEGEILFEGENITNLPQKKMQAYRPKIQMIFQDPYSFLNPCHKIRDILSEPLLVHKIVPKSEIDKEVDRLLCSVGLEVNYKDRYPSEFSGGQRQRIGIARALSLCPRFLICDEPVSALDVSVQAQILNLFKDLQEENLLTYLFIAHGLDAIRYVSDRIAIMYLGKIVEIGTTEDIFNDPLHPYTQALLNAYPVPDPYTRDEKRYILEGGVDSAALQNKGCRFQDRCRYVSERCRREQPELIGMGHVAACFLLEAQATTGQVVEEE